jgi:hypothetical protein
MCCLKGHHWIVGQNRPPRLGRVDRLRGERPTRLVVNADPRCHERESSTTGESVHFSTKPGCINLAAFPWHPGGRRTEPAVYRLQLLTKKLEAISESDDACMHSGELVHPPSLRTPGGCRPPVSSDRVEARLSACESLGNAVH